MLINDSEGPSAARPPRAAQHGPHERSKRIQESDNEDLGISHECKTKKSQNEHGWYWQWLHSELKKKNHPLEFSMFE